MNVHYICVHEDIYHKLGNRVRSSSALESVAPLTGTRDCDIEKSGLA